MQATTSIGMPIDYFNRLKVLSEKLHISRNKLMVEAIELVLAKYEH